MLPASQPILGQEKLVNFFDKIAAGQFNGSLILVGPKGAGKKTLASLLAAKLLCQDRGHKPCGACASCRELAAKINPDLFWLSPQADKKNLSIEDVRGLLHALSLSAMSYGCKVAVIDQAHILSQSAANALLKTLEEPNKKTAVILLTEVLEDLPATIVSRSQVFTVRPVAIDKVYDFLVDKRQVKRSQAKILAGLSGGWPGIALKLLADEEGLADNLAIAKKFIAAASLEPSARLKDLSQFIDKKNDVLEVIDIWQGVVRDWLLANVGAKAWARYEAVLPATAAAVPTGRLLNWQKLLVQSRNYAKANVGGQNILENIIINL